MDFNKIIKLALYTALGIEIFYLLFMFFSSPPDKFPPEPAKNEIQSLVKKVQGMGFGLNLKENVGFNTGDTISRRDAIGQAPIPEDKVGFKCVNNSGCGASGTDSLTVTETGIVTNKEIYLTVAVCFNENNERYYILVGRKTLDVRTAAEGVCQLT